MAVQSNVTDQQSVEGGESGTSSSRTAQDEIDGVSGVKEKASLNREEKETSEKDEERSMKNSHDHQHHHHHHHHHHHLEDKKSFISFHSSHRHSAERSTEHAKQPSQTQSSNMSRTINTVPVWARQQQKQKNSLHFHTNGESSHSSPKVGSVSGSSLKKPAPLHLNETNQSRTALATQDANNRQNGQTEADPRFSIDTSSIITMDDDDNHGVSRFASLSYRPVGPKIRAKLPFNEKDESVEIESADKSTSKRNTPASGGFSSAITGLLSGLTSSDAQQSHDVTNESGARNRSQSYNYEEEEKYMSGVHEGTRGGWSHDETQDDENVREQRAKVQADSSFTRHQPITPGWASPWRPESREEYSIRIGKYRFNNHGEGGYFPKTETGATSNSRRKRRRNASNGAGGGNVFRTPSLLIDMEHWRRFLLHNPFVPLLFRFINIAFTASTLAIAIKLFITLKQEGAEDAVGSSPIVAIIFAPLTLLHVGIQIYVEYFSKPIGLWRVSSKLFYTLTELIFVCLWSAVLSLSFDNYFTSTLACSALNSPYIGGGDRPVFGEQSLNNPSRKPFICRLQGALIGLVFTSLLAYVIVFSVSLFRIFVRVSKR